MLRGWMGPCLGLVLLVATVGAKADDGFAVGARPVWFVTGGPLLGATVATESKGWIAGVELSLVRLREAWFQGAYVDAYHDFGLGGTYLTGGPELGVVKRSRTLPLSIGVDAGGVLRLSDAAHYGASGRLVLTVAGTVSLFGRYAYLVSDDDAQVVQMGLVLKFPLAPPFGAGASREGSP